MATQAQIDMIYRESQARGIDPLAPLAVAEHEGLGGGIGDRGSSFGPFQLHVGGAFPSTVTLNGRVQSTTQWSLTQKHEWAWSQAGIDYALDRIKRVSVPGAQGPAEVEAIVSRFERPANIPGEVASSQATYRVLANAAQSHPAGDSSWLGGVLGTTGASTGLGGVTGAIGDAAGAVTGVVTGPIHSVEDFFSFITSWRFAEIVGGSLLLLLGLAMLAKTMGANVLPLPPAANAAMAAVPEIETPRSGRPPSSQPYARRMERVGGPPKMKKAVGAGPGTAIPY